MLDFGLTPAQRQLIGAIFASVATEGIEKVAVFGSRATGRYRPNSDLDLVVYGKVANEALCDRLWTLFQDSSLPFAVDIHSYSAVLYPPLKAHIDAVAQPFLIRQGGRLIDVGSLPGAELGEN
jgi:predicted nucleotidyltransferase